MLRLHLYRFVSHSRSTWNSVWCKGGLIRPTPLTPQARAWRTWFEKSSQLSTDLRSSFQLMCERLPMQWPHLNQMAQVALAALKCECLADK